jgi:hypothetical protein
MARGRITTIEKKALEEGYTIAYVDESAFSHCPYVQRTYHQKGQRAVLKHGPLRGGVQAISMVTPTGGLYFKVKEGSFKAEDVVQFLRQVLIKYKRKKLLIIWDRATTHRSEEVKAFLKNEAKGRIHLAMLPSHAPQLNVDEQAHGYIKQHKLANRLFITLKELHAAVLFEYQWLKCNPHLIHNFFFHKDTAFYQSSTA